MNNVVKSAVRSVIRSFNPAAGRIDPRVRPVSSVFGRERGKCIDIHYIEQFLDRHAGDIRGSGLEVAETLYLDRHREKLTTLDVLHVDAAASGATIIGDLTKPESLPEARFDCFICTQTFHLVPDPSTAIAASAKMLKPGGVLLASLPGISQISRFDMDRWGDYWRFTTKSVEMLACRSFAKEDIVVEAFGNVFAAKAVLDGLALEDLAEPGLLDFNDPDYQVVIGLRAQKSA